MTTRFVVEWGRGNERTITTPDELDAVLDEIEPLRGHGNAPFAVTVYPTDDDERSIQFGVGRPARSFMLRVEPDGGYDVDDTLDELPVLLTWDTGGQATEFLPEWTRITPAAAREAAREYVRTAQLQHA